MMTWMPRAAASRASEPVRAGVRCADEMWISASMPISSSALRASDITSQSESEPMRMRTFALMFASPGLVRPMSVRYWAPRNRTCATVS